ncbi:MAG: hydrogenase maturation protease [Acidimicrobiia bacterium]
MASSLVVGYGNDLRGDDRAGRVVASLIEEADLPGVQVLSQSQLTPEVSLEVAKVDRVVFVDASVETETLDVSAVGPGVAGPTTMSHHAEPATLLRLARDLGKMPSEAYVVSIPASNLDLGFDLSPRTARAVDEAVATIVELVSGG